MVIFLNLDGTAQKMTPQRVFQGSNNVTNIDVIAPYPNTTALDIRFILPNSTTTNSAPMKYTGKYIVENLNLYSWSYTITSSVTAQMGDLLVSINATTALGNTTSYMCKIVVEESVLPSPPPIIDDSSYNILLLYYQQNSAKIEQLLKIGEPPDTTLADLVGVPNVYFLADGRLKFEYLKGEPGEIPSTEIDKITVAVNTANKASADSATALSTANAAKTTADGVDAKATTAEMNAANASQGANKAVTDSANAVVYSSNANKTADIAKTTADTAINTSANAANASNNAVQISTAAKNISIAADNAVNNIRSPATGLLGNVQAAIDSIFERLTNGITAANYDALNLTAAIYDAKNITAIDYSVRASAILTL